MTKDGPPFPIDEVQGSLNHSDLNSDGPHPTCAPPGPAQSNLKRAQQHELTAHRTELELQIEQLRQANEKLEADRREYEELYNLAPVGYLILDEQGLIGRANLAAARLLGTSVQAMRRKRLSAYLSRTDASTFALFLRRVFSSAERCRVELSLERSEDRACVVLLDAQAVPGRQCRVALTDITTQRRAQEEVLRRSASLEVRAENRAHRIRELAEELESFASAVRHDLIAPLHGLGQAAQGLMQGVSEPSPQQLQAMRHIGAASQQLEGRLAALLELIRAGQQRLRLQPVDLNRVVAQAWREASAGLPPEALHFSLEHLPTVSGDEAALRMLFRALLDNSVKFSRGQPPIRVTVCNRPTPGDFVVCVRDSGVGFNMRRKARLFGLFQRLHDEGEFEGVGLGLALVRRIALRHGGRVWAEGKPGQGTTVWVSFPRQPREVA